MPNELSPFQKIIKPRNAYFDSGVIHFLSTLQTNEGLVLFYYVNDPFFLGAALLDPLNPENILYRSVNPIWKTQEKIEPLFISKKLKKIYFHYHSKKTTQTVLLNLNNLFDIHKKTPEKLKRTPNNPILKPNPRKTWESSAVFNSGALYLNDQVHFIYRAITASGESVLGYAVSDDGSKITERSENPVYFLNKSENKVKKHGKISCFYSSGKNWHGCEDPRLSKIGDFIYMTYTAWHEALPPYVALTSIKVSDFLKKQWRWTTPIQISQHNELHKNWVVFPEKINGKYTILHSLSPSIGIEYLTSLKKIKKQIESYYYPDKREKCWDNLIRGAGPPPIKTKEGWLLLYHAMDCNDPNKYKIGAMILDLKNPSKILYRSSYPVLEPEMHYENHGHKSGVVYACGAVIIDNTLFVYYGGADTVLCCAKHNLPKLLSAIKNS